MNTACANDCKLADTSAMLARWLLGGLFLYLGLQKGLAPVEFLKLIRQYDLVQTPWLLNSIAAALPWFEVFCGLLLLAGVAVRGAALWLVVLLVPFSLAILRRALEVQAAQGLPFCTIKFDCGCGAGEVLICRKLAENLLLVALAAWIAFTRHGRRWSLRHSLFD